MVQLSEISPLSRASPSQTDIYRQLQALLNQENKSLVQNTQNSVNRIQENNLKILNNNVDFKIMNTGVDNKAQILGAQLNLIQSVISKLQ